MQCICRKSFQTRQIRKWPKCKKSVRNGLHNLYLIRLRTVTSQSHNNRLAMFSTHFYSFFSHFDNQHLALLTLKHMTNLSINLKLTRDQRRNAMRNANNRFLTLSPLLTCMSQEHSHNVSCFTDLPDGLSL